MIGPAGFMASPPSEFDDCEYCTHCQTINEDMDNYCHLNQRVVHEVCVKFEHIVGKKKPTQQGERNA